jgi:two-component system response regulator
MAGERRDILLVEDSADDVVLVKRALRSVGMAADVALAGDGEEALAALFGRGGEEPGSVPKVVILDLKFPKVDGLEVLRRIRTEERTRLLPVVVLISSSEASDLVRSYEHGANSYVRKEVDFQRLCEAVRRIGLYWVLLNEVPHETRPT